MLTNYAIWLTSGWALPTCVCVPVVVVTYLFYRCLASNMEYAARRRLITGRNDGVSVHHTQIIPSVISHQRMFPKRHGFRYPYLSVGIPVRSPTCSRLLSVDTAEWWRRGWLHVSANDHLHRGMPGATLAEKLDAYLKDQVLNSATLFILIYPMSGIIN